MRSEAGAPEAGQLAEAGQLGQLEPRGPRWPVAPGRRAVAGLGRGVVRRFVDRLLGCIQENECQSKLQPSEWMTLVLC